MFGILAGFDALVIALAFAAALLVTGSIIRPLLVSVLSSAPFIGGWLAGSVDRSLANFQHGLMGPANAALGVLASALNWIETWGRSLVWVLVNLHTAIWTDINAIRTLSIPQAVGQALARAEALVADARAAALLGVQEATTALRGLIAQAETTGAALVNGARLEALGLFTQARVEAVALEGQAESVAHGLFLQAEADATLLAGRAEAVAQQLSAAEHTFAAGVLSTLTTDLQRVEAAAGVAISDTRAILGGDIAEAEKRAGNVAAQLAAQPAEAVKNIENSPEWHLLQALVGNGGALLETELVSLARSALKGVQDEMGSLQPMIARGQSLVEAFRADLRKGA